MKLTLESTTQLVEVHGIEGRVWEGVTERGVKVQAVITRIAVARADDNSQFERELVEKDHKTPPEPRAFDPRLIL